jgi:hypothetical protein
MIRERWKFACRSTALRLRRQIATGILVAVIAFLILRLLFDWAAALQEVVAIGVAVTVVEILVPLLSFLWNFATAPLHLQIESLTTSLATSQANIVLSISSEVGYSEDFWTVEAIFRNDPARPTEAAVAHRVVGYVDYLDESGNQVGSCVNWLSGYGSEEDGVTLDVNAVPKEFWLLSRRVEKNGEVVIHNPGSDDIPCLPVYVVTIRLKGVNLEQSWKVRITNPDGEGPFGVEMLEGANWPT